MEVERRKVMARRALSRLSRERHPPVALNLRDGEVVERAAQLIDAGTTRLRIALDSARINDDLDALASFPGRARSVIVFD